MKNNRDHRICVRFTSEELLAIKSSANKDGSEKVSTHIRDVVIKSKKVLPQLNHIKKLLKENK